MDKHIAVPAVDICGSNALWLAARVGASLQLVRRLWRVAAKRLSVFAQLIWERLGAREGSLPWPSLCLHLSQQNCRTKQKPRDNANVTRRCPNNVTAAAWRPTVQDYRGDRLA